MKTIRNHVFETNSSSMHSISFNSDYPEDQNGYKLEVTGEGDCGWSIEDDYVDDPEGKMNYALIAYY